MKVLFLGGTGRLSKDAVRRAVDDGHEVYIITRGSKNREQFVNEKCVSLIGDIRKPATCKKYFDKEKEYDVIVDFLSLNVENIASTLKMIGNSYVQYVFISSATVFKRNNKVITERTERGNNLWKYAYDKYLCEEYLKEFFLNRNDSFYTIVRPYITYGNTRVPYPLVPRNALTEWSFVDRIRRGQPIPTFDNGGTVTALMNTKDFSFLLVGLFGNKDAYNEDFIIADEERTTWADVLKNLEKITQKEIIRVDFSKKTISSSMPEYKQVLFGDKGVDACFCIDKIKSVVPGFEKSVPLYDGLNEMISFYDNNPRLRVIDYYWNGKLDRLFVREGICCDTRQYEFRSLRDYVDYLYGRYRIMGCVRYVLIKVSDNRITRFLKKLNK